MWFLSHVLGGLGHSFSQALVGVEVAFQKAHLITHACSCGLDRLADIMT